MNQPARALFPAPRFPQQQEFQPADEADFENDYFHANRQ